METSRPQPDTDESPAGSDTGAGYPEEQPDGANPGEEKEDRESPEPAAPTVDGGGADSSPPTATGNPRAAG